MRRGRRLCAWTAVCLGVVLVGRWLAYAVAPAPTALAARLQGETVPPDPAILAAVVLGIAAVVSFGAVWFAAMGVAERHRLDPRAVAPEPISIRTMAVRTLALFVSSSLVFSGLESYIHVRAGLGFHGLHCLLGPVHQDVLPFLAALSLLSAAVGGVVEHVLAWIRRTIALLAGGRRRRVGEQLSPRRPVDLEAPRPAVGGRANAARAPPAAGTTRAAPCAVRPLRRRSPLPI